ncbi:uncharacterized protein LOC141673476 [Apium graveolens]|uniref:uncharacterized protein LOC141673476 n=1 Tax=Apium graveolens TaxID=4045 RepID=UPI003D7B8CB1
MYTTVAKDIWDDFSIRFDQTKVPKLFNLRKDIGSLTQGNLSISAYFTKFRTLNDELEALSPVPRCDCGKCTCTVNTKLDNFSKITKLSQFLVGLGDHYTFIHGHLLLINPILSLSEAYSLLMHEENQRDLGANISMNSNSVALSVKTSNGRYTKEKCFCVTGYPSWHRLHGTPKPRPKSTIKTAQAHNISKDSSSEQQSSGITVDISGGFTTAQCQYIMTMIQIGLKELAASSNQMIVPSHMADHITPHFELLTDVTTINSILHLPNGHTTPATHIGTVYLHTNIVLHDVLLGHPSVSSMQYLPASMYNKSVHFIECDTCHLLKQTRLQFSESSSNSTTLFELVHIDVWVPYHYETHGNCSKFLTSVEDMSRATWVFLFADKSQVHDLLIQFIAYVSKQFSCSIKAFRSDNGSEFINTKLQTHLASLGIIHQKSCTYTPQQNGVVERKHKTMLNTARALRLQASLPISFWGDCILTATYLLNRTPIQKLQGKTPYHVLFSKAPLYDHLKVFGSLCYATNTQPHKDKFSNRAHKCIFLGYLFAQKSYKVMDLETKKVFISRDVIFCEQIFPFRTMQKSAVPSHLFNNNPSCIHIDPFCDTIVVPVDQSPPTANMSPLSDTSIVQSPSTGSTDLPSPVDPISSVPHVVSTRLQCHLDAAHRVVRYLKHTLGQGIVLSANCSLALTAYADADWGGCQITRQSLMGYCVTLGDSLLSWKSKK